jgi:2-oxo-4-hydroxy-4-carboxy-5-ureidoimidazoline decarboxylase
MNVPEDKQAFVARFGGVFEHSPWVAERAWPRGPFATADSLHQAMMQALGEASRAEQLALVRAHPELAGREAKAGALTADSSGEQARLGFTSLERDEFLKMQRINRAYREKFGFPCIVALRLHATRQSVVAEMQRRLGNNAEQELAGALAQIGHITRGRLDRLFGEE